MTERHLGKYQILEEIGKGGFATVYRAQDLDLSRPVALKVLDPVLTRDPIWVARFRREARAVASLDHPRVVTIHEIGQAEGALYIAMKLVEGGSLAQRIAAQGPLSWDEVARLTEQIAEALDFAHGQGVLHRDLKPANVLLDPRLGAVLTDFGFARLVADNSLSISMSGGVVGTPAYIAPEVWEGEDPSPQTDVYALGCMVYEMATGHALFAGNSTPAVMRAHFQPRKLPETWPEGTPKDLTDVLLTALAQEPVGRYARAGELAAVLVGLREDPLAAPYAELQAAVADGRWQEALTLAGQVRAVDGGYRDVGALEVTAFGGLEREARVQQAVEWRAEAECALADGDLKGAGLAVRKWQELVPDDTQVAEFQKKLEHQKHVKHAVGVPQETEHEAQQDILVATLSSAGTPPENGGPQVDSTSSRRRRAWPGLALGAVAVLAAIVLLSRVLPGGETDVMSTPQLVAEATTTSVPAIATSVDEVTVTVPWTALVATDTPQPATPSATWTPLPPTDTPTSSPSPTRRPTEKPTVSRSANLTSVVPTLVSTVSHSNQGVCLAFIGTDYSVWVLDENASGNQARSLQTGNACCPSWSPDGETIVYRGISEGDNHDIYVINADGSGKVRLTTSPGWDWAPAWSPDGSRIAFVSNRDGQTEVYVMDANGANQTNLTQSPYEDWDPVWSPDGQKIAFPSNRSGVFEVWVMNPDGTELQPLTFLSGVWVPSWSPDGRQMVFHIERGDQSEIWRIDANGSEPTQITFDKQYNTMPEFSPDGTRIAFASRRSGRDEIYVMTTSGTNLRQITNIGGSQPSWCPAQ